MAQASIAPAAANSEDSPVSSAQGDDRMHWMMSTPFFLVHLGAVAVLFFAEWSWHAWGIVLASYVLRMFGVTGGYHRYFSHRTYKTSRVFQFVLALVAMSSTQKGVLWWAAHHRHHHRFSDEDNDVHSMKKRGFWWSHVGWILSTRWDHTDMSKIKDLSKYPELRWLNRFHLVPTLVYLVALYALWGMQGLLWGYVVSTVLVWHGTFTINSLSHWLGKRVYATTDESRNSWVLAIVTMGEGWHNNHHHFQASTRQGFRAYEIDVTYMILKAMSWVRLVWDLREPPPQVVAARSS